MSRDLRKPEPLKQVQGLIDGIKIEIGKAWARAKTDAVNNFEDKASSINGLQRELRRISQLLHGGLQQAYMLGVYRFWSDYSRPRRKPVKRARESMREMLRDIDADRERYQEQRQRYLDSVGGPILEAEDPAEMALRSQDLKRIRILQRIQDHYLEHSLGADTVRDIGKAHDPEDLAKSFDGKAARTASYAESCWPAGQMSYAVEAEDMRQATGEGLWCDFIGPDDSSTCDGCSAAVEGAPYPLTPDVPMPGEFDCMTRCRHFLVLCETPDWAGVPGAQD